MDSDELHLRLLEQETKEVRHFNWLATVWIVLSWSVALPLAFGLAVSAGGGVGPGRLFAAVLLIGVAVLGYYVVGHCHERVTYHRLRSLVHWERMPFDESVHDQLGEVNRARRADTSGYTGLLRYALLPLVAIGLLLVLL